MGTASTRGGIILKKENLIPKASSSDLGGIIVGEDFTIDTDGILHLSNSQKLLNNAYKKYVFREKNWGDLPANDGRYNWKYGNEVFHFSWAKSLVLNKKTLLWENVEWQGAPYTGHYWDGRYVWTDGNNVYYTRGDHKYILNVKSRAAESVNITGAPDSFIGSAVWTDGMNIYYSYGSEQYIFNKETKTWSATTQWSGVTSFSGGDIWSDGWDIYCYSGAVGGRYKLDIINHKWTASTDYTTNLHNNVPATCYFYFDGDIYYRGWGETRKLNLNTKSWEDITNSFILQTDSGASVFQDGDGYNFWTDGEHLYYDYGDKHYIGQLEYVNLRLGGSA
jgi:hypothetical protein